MAFKPVLTFKLALCLWRPLWPANWHEKIEQKGRAIADRRSLVRGITYKGKIQWVEAQEYGEGRVDFILHRTDPCGPDATTGYTWGEVRGFNATKTLTPTT